MLAHEWLCRAATLEEKKESFRFFIRTMGKKSTSYQQFVDETGREPIHELYLCIGYLMLADVQEAFA